MQLPVLPSPVRVALALITAGVILAGSLSAGNAVLDRTSTVPYNDELLHVLGYGLLALTVTYAYLPDQPRPLRRGALVFAGVLAYGLVIEALQALVPARRPDLGDAVADALGASLAFVWDGLVVRWVQGDGSKGGG